MIVQCCFVVMIVLLYMYLNTAQNLIIFIRCSPSAAKTHMLWKQLVPWLIKSRLRISGFCTDENRRNGQLIGAYKNNMSLPMSSIRIGNHREIKTIVEEIQPVQRAILVLDVECSWSNLAATVYRLINQSHHSIVIVSIPMIQGSLVSSLRDLSDVHVFTVESREHQPKVLASIKTTIMHKLIQGL